MLRVSGTEAIGGPDSEVVERRGWLCEVRLVCDGLLGNLNLETWDHLLGCC